MSRDDTLAFWIAAPGRGELRREALPTPGAGRPVYGHFTAVSAAGPRRPYLAATCRAANTRGCARHFRPDSSRHPSSTVTSMWARSCTVARACRQRCLLSLSAPATLRGSLRGAVPAARIGSGRSGRTGGKSGDGTQRLVGLGASPGDRITVIGAGSVGCLVAWLAARIAGCEVQLVDINPHREAVARSLGVRFALPGSATPKRTLCYMPAVRPRGCHWDCVWPDSKRPSSN